MSDAPVILQTPTGTVMLEGSRGLPAGQDVAITAPAVAVVLTPDSASTQIMSPSADIVVTLASAVTDDGKAARITNNSPTGNTLTITRHADDGGTVLAIMGAGEDLFLESTGTVANNWQIVTRSPGAFVNAIAVPDATNVQLTADQGPIIIATKAVGPGASQVRLPAISIPRYRQRIWTIILDNTASGAAVAGGDETAILSLRGSAGVALVPPINVAPAGRQLVTLGFDGAGAWIPLDGYSLENNRAWMQGTQTVIVDDGGAPTVYNILPGDTFCTVNNNTAGGDNMIVELPLATGSGRLIGFNFLDLSGGTFSFGPAAGDQIQGGGADVDLAYDALQNDGVVWLRDHGTQQWRFDYVDAGAVVTEGGDLQGSLGILTAQTWTTGALGQWLNDGDGAFTNGGGLVGNDATLTVAAANRAWAFDNGTAAWNQLSLTAADAQYTANFQLFPDVPTDEDAVYFGDNNIFNEIAFDMVVMQASAVGNAPFTWEYWDGAAWVTWAAGGYAFFDNTPTAGATTGVRAFERDGAVTFEAPDDWAQNDPGMGETAYWVRCRVTTVADIGGGIGTVAAEQSVVSPTAGFFFPNAGSVGSVRVSTGATAGPTANVVFQLTDQANDNFSEALTFLAGRRAQTFGIATPAGFEVETGNPLGIYCFDDGGGASFIENAIIELSVALLDV